MSNTSLRLFIAGNFIHQDADGRYSLNDLHRAAGGDDKHSPNRFARLDSTQALCAEVDQTPLLASGPALLVLNGGAAPGTYACKELVYAYAMWISAAFMLVVIRAYDALVSHDAPRPGQTEAIEALRLRAENSRLKDRIIEMLEVQVGASAADRAGLPTRHPKLWTPEEETKALQLRAEGWTCSRIGVALGRSWGSVNCKLTELRFRDLARQEADGETIAQVSP